MSETLAGYLPEASKVFPMFRQHPYAVGFIIFSLIAAVSIALWVIRNTQYGIPIATSHIEMQSFSNYAGFPLDIQREDAQSISYGEVTITNISTKEKVALDIALHITGSDKTNIRISADLRGPFGMVLGKDDKVAKHFANAPFGEALKYFRNPIELTPGQVERRRLEFLFNFGESKIRDEIVTIVSKRENYNFDLEIADLISGNKTVVRLPGDYRGD